MVQLSMREADYEPIFDDDEAYLEDDDDEAYLEDDYEVYEAKIKSKWKGGKKPGSSKYSYGTGYKGGQLKSSTGGTAQVQFSKPMVSKEEFDKALEMVRQDIRKESAAIASLDKRHSSDFKSLRGRIEQSSMYPLLLTFMQPKPEISTIKGTALIGTSETPQNITITSTETKLKEEKDITPFLLMMMMGGGGFMGMGGESGEKSGGMQDMMMMLLLVQALP